MRQPRPGPRSSPRRRPSPASKAEGPGPARRGCRARPRCCPPGQRRRSPEGSVGLRTARFQEIGATSAAADVESHPARYASGCCLLSSRAVPGVTATGLQCFCDCIKNYFPSRGLAHDQIKTLLLLGTVLLICSLPLRTLSLPQHLPWCCGSNRRSAWATRCLHHLSAAFDLTSQTLAALPVDGHLKITPKLYYLWEKLWNVEEAAGKKL